MYLEADFLYVSFQNSNFDYKGAFNNFSLTFCLLLCTRKNRNLLQVAQKKNGIFSCLLNSTISDNSHLFSVLQKTRSSVKALGGICPACSLATSNNPSHQHSSSDPTGEELGQQRAWKWES